ncbi:MAG: TraM recognition domain-containing protein, partial [Crocosphaera sp.]
LGWKPLTFLIPSCNPLIEVMGKSGSGKTYSVINPLLMSAIEQGHPILLYEAKADSQGKGGQMDFLITYAKKHGYEVNILAPGRPYSCTINPLDFMKDYQDATMAKIIGDTLHANLGGKNDKKDGFFGPAGARLVRACLQFAKAQQQEHGVADLAMAFAVLSLSDLPKRLLEAKKQSKFPFWSQVPFEQLMSVADAAPTSGGILGGAMDLLESLLEPNLLKSYVGQTNTPLMLGKKQMLVMQTDTERMPVVNSLLATLITLIINKNFSVERDCPLIACFDEFPTLVLDPLPDWANRLRSKGLVLMLGYQEYNQIEKNYSKEDTAIIRGPATHKFLFNPGTFNTAEDLSKSLGQTETVVKNISRSRNFGLNGGGSRSISEQVIQHNLMSADEILNMTIGQCIYRGSEMVQKVVDPRTKKTKLTTRPLYPQRLPLPKNYDPIEQNCQNIFQTKLYPWFVKRFNNPHWNAESALKFRQALANQLLPNPQQEPPFPNSQPGVNFPI